MWVSGILAASLCAVSAFSDATCAAPALALFLALLFTQNRFQANPLFSILRWAKQQTTPTQLVAALVTNLVGTVLGCVLGHLLWDTWIHQIIPDHSWNTLLRYSLSQFIAAAAFIAALNSMEDSLNSQLVPFYAAGLFTVALNFSLSRTLNPLVPLAGPLVKSLWEGTDYEWAKVNWVLTLGGLAGAAAGCLLGRHLSSSKVSK